MRSLFVRNLLFTLLQPGIVAGVLPYLLINNFDKAHDLKEFAFGEIMGLGIFISGLALMLNCIYNFAATGKGTLSPLDPTKNLVVSGLYKYSRNPMYVAVLMILLGETVFFKAPNLMLYTICIALCFNAFVRYFEEPRLRRDFGASYDSYCKQVKRWL